MSRNIACVPFAVKPGKEGFIYISLAEEPETNLAQVLAPLREEVVGRFDMVCYQTVLRETMVWNANWKNLIENFTESYHVPIAHGKTFAMHKKSLSDYVWGEDSDYYGYHRATQPQDSGWVLYIQRTKGCPASGAE